MVTLPAGRNYLPYQGERSGKTLGEVIRELSDSLIKNMGEAAKNFKEAPPDPNITRTDRLWGGIPVNRTAVAAKEIVNASNSPVSDAEANAAMQTDDRNNPISGLMKPSLDSSALVDKVIQSTNSPQQTEQPAPTPVVQPQGTAEQPDSTDSKTVLDGLTFDGAAQDKKAYEDAKKAAWEAEAKRRQEEFAKESALYKTMQSLYGQPEDRNSRYMNAPVFDQNALPYAQGLLELKEMHLHADQYAEQLGLTPDQVRDWANQEATKVRQMAQAAGIGNLEGYGSDVTFYDSANYLGSNNARARVEGLTKYADSSQDVYQNTYDKFLLRGENSRIASALAERAARYYQQDRINYLRDMFHAYGLEDGYANDWGTQILAQMAEENPALANYYTNLHGTPKELLGRAEKLRDEAMKNAHELLKQGKAAEANALLEAIKHGYNLERIDRTKTWDAQNAEARDERDLQRQVTLKEIDAKIKAQEKITDFNNQVSFANKLYSDGDIDKNQYNALVASAYDFTGASSIFGVGKGTSGDPTKARREALNGYSNQLKITLENYRKRLKEINDLIGPYGKATPEQQAQIDDLNTRISEVETHLDKALEEYGYLIEQTAPPRFSKDDPQRTANSLQEMDKQMKEAGYNYQQRLETVRRALKENGYTDEEIDQFANGLYPSEVSRKLQEGMAALDKR